MKRYKSNSDLVAMEENDLKEEKMMLKLKSKKKLFNHVDSIISNMSEDDTVSIKARVTFSHKEGS
jgi:hypothetical protein